MRAMCARFFVWHAVDGCAQVVPVGPGAALLVVIGTGRTLAPLAPVRAAQAHAQVQAQRGRQMRRSDMRRPAHSCLSPAAALGRLSLHGRNGRHGCNGRNAFHGAGVRDRTMLHLAGHWPRSWVIPGRSSPPMDGLPLPGLFGLASVRVGKGRRPCLRCTARVGTLRFAA
jgi:hypothetical protein